jgi:hypothetical protein
MSMKTNVRFFFMIMFIFGTAYAQVLAADKVVVVPLAGKANAAGADGQFLINSGGKIAGTDVWYDKRNGNYGIGVRTIHDDIKLEVAGPTWFWLRSFNDDNRHIILGTPGGWPGIISLANGKRSDISFHEGFINLAASYNDSPPSLDFGLTVTDTGRVGINTLSPVSTLEVRGEIRSTDATGDNRLWGRGRPGVTAFTDTSGYNCTDGGYRFSISSVMVSWDSAADACPAGTWVCTSLERGSNVCAPHSVSTTYVNCAGDENDATIVGGIGAYNNIPAWVADANTVHPLDGMLVRLQGNLTQAPVCEYRPVWCCSM